MKLALGTAQFGLAYGVVGRATRPGDDEARQVFARAAALGIDLLDTAAAYGDIEQRLSLLTAPGRFGIVSKIPALPECVAMSPEDATAFVSAALHRSRERLGGALDSVLFHSADDLLGPHGDALWNAASALTAEWGVRLGVSCYGPAQLQRLGERFPVAVAQLPGNVFDQRLSDRRFPGVELHVRSAFLQGLLLVRAEVGGQRLPAAAASLRRWQAGCAERGLAPLTAALGAVKALPGVQRCVVGVDSVAQLDEIAAAWDAATPLIWPQFATEDPSIIDPRAWSRP